MKNQDLIEDIKAKLKASQELPYREGAWERYAAQQGINHQSTVFTLKRLASIAAAGILMLGVSLYVYKSQYSAFNSPIESQLTKTTRPVINKPVDNNAHIRKGVEIPDADLPIQENSSVALSVAKQNIRVKNQLATISSIEGVSQSNLIYNAQTEHSIARFEVITLEALPYKATLQATPRATFVNPSIATLAHQIANLGSNPEVNNLKQQSKMALGDKLQLGLYVSPHKTADKFDVGAGFLVSYALTPKISLRTGTSYNAYSVGKLKDPMETANAEVVAMESPLNSSNIATDNLYASKQQMMLPNVNAVMGKVEAIEIPLDITYNFNKGFYSSAGVSYSAIINQQREAQYIENVGILSLQDKASLIPNAAQKLNTTQVKTVKSMQDNVNTNGFNGFANFSVGKKANLKNNISISLEPYLKVPLGQYRKSDLDYTNSGIRIITTF